MPSESVNPVTGQLQQGYACANCGNTCNMYATGHFSMKEDKWLCENRRARFSSPERIKEIEQELKAKGYL